MCKLGWTLYVLTSAGINDAKSCPALATSAVLMLSSQLLCPPSHLTVRKVGQVEKSLALYTAQKKKHQSVINFVFLLKKKHSIVSDIKENELSPNWNQDKLSINK